MNLLRSLVKLDLRIFGLVFTAIFLVAVIHALRLPRLYEANGTAKFHSSDDESSHRSGADTPSWRPIGAVAPRESDYLIAPIVVRFSWGFAAAVIGGLLVVGVVNIFTLGRDLADNQKEAA